VQDRSFKKTKKPTVFVCACTQTAKEATTDEARARLDAPGTGISPASRGCLFKLRTSNPERDKSGCYKVLESHLEHTCSVIDARRTLGEACLGGLLSPPVLCTVSLCLL
jgi:hypothetical protein